MDPNGDYLFRIRTVKAAPIRTLSEALKEILTEANIEIDQTGLKIMAMDGTHTVLVHLRLHAIALMNSSVPRSTFWVST